MCGTMKRFALLLCLIGFTTNAHAEFEKLKEIATKSLEKNIVSLSSGSYLRAGATQFQALWTRDFCLASRGLYVVGRSDVIRDQIKLYLHHLNSDGLAPRFMDSVPIEWRYVKGWMGQEVHLQDPLKPSWRGWYLQPAIDGNALIIHTALTYREKSGDELYFRTQLDGLKKALKFYKSRMEDDLVFQPGWSDWQDSAKRRGHSAYMNIVYQSMLRKALEFPEFGVTIEQVKKHEAAFLKAFLDSETGIFRSLVGHPYFSLDAPLLALDWDFYPRNSIEATNLYANLKKHPLWTVNDSMPGLVTIPDYPQSWVGWVEWAFGVRHYHDHTYWSWLMGLSAKVALKMGDIEMGKKILAQIETMAIRDGWVGEIFHEYPPFKLWTAGAYISERPFSWGSGMILDALAEWDRIHNPKKPSKESQAQAFERLKKKQPMHMRVLGK